MGRGPGPGAGGRAGGAGLVRHPCRYLSMYCHWPLGVTPRERGITIYTLRCFSSVIMLIHPCRRFGGSAYLGFERLTLVPMQVRRQGVKEGEGL